MISPGSVRMTLTRPVARIIVNACTDVDPVSIACKGVRTTLAATEGSRPIEMMNYGRNDYTSYSGKDYRDVKQNLGCFLLDQGLLSTRADVFGLDSFLIMGGRAYRELEQLVRTLICIKFFNIYPRAVELIKSGDALPAFFNEGMAQLSASGIKGNRTLDLHFNIQAIFPSLDDVCLKGEGEPQISSRRAKHWDEVTGEPGYYERICQTLFHMMPFEHYMMMRGYPFNVDIFKDGVMSPDGIKADVPFRINFYHWSDLGKLIDFLTIRGEK